MALPSGRAYVHVFGRARLQKPQEEVLFRSLEVASVRTLRTLQAEGLIDQGHKITPLPDEGLGVLFFEALEQRGEPLLHASGFPFGGVATEKSEAVFPIQLADVTTSSFGRKLNGPGEVAKDETTEHVLGHWGVENTLRNGTYTNLAVLKHGAALPDTSG